MHRRSPDKDRTITRGGILSEIAIFSAESLGRDFVEHAVVRINASHLGFLNSADFLETEFRTDHGNRPGGVQT